MRYRTEDQMMLALIRHGETAANREHRYLGRTDEPLSAEGIKTLLSYRDRNCYPRIDSLFASPMRRCLETARILYPTLTVSVIREWREIDFGRFEYQNYEELKTDRQYQAWIDSGGTMAFPGGESRADFVRRCKKGFEWMCGELRRRAAGGGILTGEGKRRDRILVGIDGHSGRKIAEVDTPGDVLTVGAVVHGGTIMALLSAYSGMDYFDAQAENGRGYLCRIVKERQEDVSGEAEERQEGKGKSEERKKDSKMSEEEVLRIEVIRKL